MSILILARQIIIRYRLLAVILMHIIFAGLSLWTSFLLRFDFSLGDASHARLFFLSLPVNIIVFLFFSGIFGLFQGIWRYVSVDDLKDMVKASAIASLVFMSIIVFSGKFSGYPRSIFLLNFVLFIILNGGLRFSIRIFRETYAPMSDSAKNVLIIGAGSTGNEIAKALKSAKNKEYIPVGFIDHDHGTHGKRLQGLKVFGDISGIKQIIKKNRIREVFIAIPEATNKVVKQIVEASKVPEWEVKFKIVPSMLDIMSGKLRINQIREVSIEDLLSRPNIKLADTHVRPHIAGKCILITGAGGSIGSEICYQVASYSPARMVPLDMNEKNAYDIDLEMKTRHPEIEFVTAIGSIVDLPWLQKLMNDFKPHHVYHAAAYKHVHLMEWNPFTCISNNVIGTYNLAQASINSGVEKFVMISTDKAVKPKAIMGISKRISERIVLELFQDQRTIFNVVRFGNVLGSSGSVVPLFQKQIRAGGPITITHPEVCRYFMSIPEAVQLVLQAATLKNTGCVYLLEMGEPVKIADLAYSLIELSGLKPGEDIEIRFTGLREGEKLFEELLTHGEDVLETPFEKIRVHRPQKSDKNGVLKNIKELKESLESLNLEKLNKTIGKLVPEGTME